MGLSYEWRGKPVRKSRDEIFFLRVSVGRREGERETWDFTNKLEVFLVESCGGGRAAAERKDLGLIVACWVRTSTDPNIW